MCLCHFSCWGKSERSTLGIRLGHFRYGYSHLDYLVRCFSSHFPLASGCSGTDSFFLLWEHLQVVEDCVLRDAYLDERRVGKALLSQEAQKCAYEAEHGSSLPHGVQELVLLDAEVTAQDRFFDDEE